MSFVFRRWLFDCGAVCCGLALASGATLLSAGCKSFVERSVDRSSAATVEVGAYCRTLAVGQPWSPEAASSQHFQVSQEAEPSQLTYCVSQSMGFSRCIVRLDGSGQIIENIQYFPD